MSLLNKAQILAADDRKFIDVEVPEWGGAVRVSAMSGLQRDAYEMLLLDRQKNGAGGSIRAALAASTIVDESGAPVFTIEDVEALEKKSGAALGRIFDAAIKLSKLEPAAVEEAVKN